MKTSVIAAEPRGALRVCLWCVIAVLAEVALYASYRGHDARFHWFTHFFVGAAVALVVMAVVAARTRRPVPLPLVWPFLAHVVAMFPDFLFAAGVAHYRWMDVFFGHISTISSRGATSRGSWCSLSPSPPYRGARPAPRRRG